jgi:PAS domain S-box-containing protein
MKKTDNNDYLSSFNKFCRGTDSGESLLHAHVNGMAESLNELNQQYYEAVCTNQILIRNLSDMRKENYSQKDRNDVLLHHIDFLENILNNLQIIISLRDLKRNNLLWHNDNYKLLLGYRHKELQEIYSSSDSSLYHPNDVEKLQARQYELEHNKGLQTYSCSYRLKNKQGNWIPFNSNWQVMKRDKKNNPWLVLEVLTVLSPVQAHNLK